MMVTINLLPWRQSLRRYQNKRMNQLIGIFTILPLLLVVGLHAHYLMQKNQLRAACQQLDDQIEKKQSIQEISGNKAQRVMVQTLGPLLQSQQMLQQFFKEFSKPTNGSVCFNEINKQSNTIVFKGEAHSIDDLTDFLRHWQMMLLFSELKIEKLVQLSRGVQFQFIGLVNS